MIQSGCPSHRVLTAIRQYHREHGLAPSQAEIARRARVHREHVRRYLRQLQRDGLLTYEPGQRFSIRLVDRVANLSDMELVLACVGRGIMTGRSPVPALVEAYQVDPRITDDDRRLLDRLP